MLEKGRIKWKKKREGISVVCVRVFGINPSGFFIVLLRIHANISSSWVGFCFSFLPPDTIHPQIYTSVMMFLLSACYSMKIGRNEIMFQGHWCLFPLSLQDFPFFYVRNECFSGISNETTPVEFMFHSFPLNSRWKYRLSNALEIYFLYNICFLFYSIFRNLL